MKGGGGKKGGKKGKKKTAKTPVVIDGISTEEMTKEQVDSIFQWLIQKSVYIRFHVYVFRPLKSFYAI